MPEQVTLQNLMIAFKSTMPDKEKLAELLRNDRTPEDKLKERIETITNNVWAGLVELSQTACGPEGRAARDEIFNRIVTITDPITANYVRAAHDTAWHDRHVEHGVKASDTSPNAETLNR